MYLESYSGDRSEPVGLCRLRKRVTETKGGPLEFGERMQRSGQVESGVGRGRARHWRAP